MTSTHDRLADGGVHLLLTASLASSRIMLGSNIAAGLTRREDVAPPTKPAPAHRTAIDWRPLL